MISFLSWNCQGFKTNGPWLRSIIQDYDVIALQETWLHDFESRQLNVSREFFNISKSAMPKTRLNSAGRPYGGVAFLIKNTIKTSILEVSTGDTRIVALKIITQTADILVINVYLPVNNKENESLISQYMGKLNSMVINHDGPVIIMGDFNIDPKHPNFGELLQLCKDTDCVLADFRDLHSQTYTFCSKGTGSTSWLDHYIISKEISASASTPYVVTPSDHIPVKLHTDLEVNEVSNQQQKTTRTTKVDWKTLPKSLLDLYTTSTTTSLCRLLPMKLCEVSNCRLHDHHKDISTLYKMVTSALRESYSKLVSQQQKISKFRESFIPGWNDYLRDQYKLYKEYYIRWNQSGRSDSFAFQCMKTQHKIFKSTLRRVRRNKNKILSKKLALSYRGNNLVKFWRTVKAQDSSSSNKESAPTTVEGAVGESDICEMWRQHYASAFKSDQTDLITDSFKHKIKVHETPGRVSHREIQECIGNLKKGKAAGPDNIASEQFIYAGYPIHQIFANIYNSCLAHAFIPSEIMHVIIVPILKKKGLDATKTSNYRPIAIATVTSKLFELLILESNYSKLTTQPGQFGYKKGVGTETAIFTLRQVCHHYMRHETSVYVCYLDASKAFDCVNHKLILDKLKKRGVDSETIDILSFWFINQRFLCRWNNEISGSFPVQKGVRQGGILSAYLFAIYMDDLCVQLANSNIGCKVGSVPCNYLCYADDFCLLATTIQGLSLLISISESYARNHDIVFNPSKTFCQSFMPRTVDTYRPSVKLGGKCITWAETVKYLGYDVSCWDRDTAKLLRRKRELYANANLLSCRFRHCSNDVKVYLFKTFFSNIYCNSLWVPLSVKSLKSVQVAYNDAFRSMFGYSRMHSASQMFAENGVQDFNAMCRRSAFSLLRRLSTSENIILINIMNSNVMLQSSLNARWRSLLLCNEASALPYLS